MTAEWIGVVRVGLKVPAVDGEEALFLSRKGFGEEETEGQSDGWGQTPRPRAAGGGGRAPPRARLPSVLDMSRPRGGSEGRPDPTLSQDLHPQSLSEEQGKHALGLRGHPAALRL